MVAEQRIRGEVAQNRTILVILALAAAVGSAVAAATVGAAAAAIAAFLAGVTASAAFFAPAGQKGEIAPAAPELAPSDLPDGRALIDASEEPILLVRGRQVVLANPAARTLLGDHIEGDDVRLAIRHPAAAERLLENPEEAREPVIRTDLAGLGDPEQRWEMAISTLADGTRVVRLIDHSHTYAAEQMRVDFVANASHELRTPLATLLGFLETLEDEEAAGDPETRRRFLGIMADEAARMRALVDDLMSLSRIEADRYSIPREPVELLPLVETVRTTLARLLEQRGASLSVDNQANGAIVAGDRSQLTQLLTNLVTNALRYGRAGAPVTVRLEDAGAEMIRLSVIDQGEGIAPEHLPRLTERFYRVDASRSRSVGGTGLGLAIVKHIALRHRGRLDIRSTLGEGTSVRVYLPRFQA